MEFFETYWLEILGTLSGLVCVWLLIKESVLTFPIGLLYAVITSAVVIEARLYADLVLNLYFVLMNGYGWYFWIRGADERHEALGIVIDMKRTGQRYLYNMYTVYWFKLGNITQVPSAHIKLVSL